ncbi:hypothetical protein PHLCEN_2v9866 [Hermanssonia centrifuga]|uniref:Uncharacterized protein n=1 Tax=Hermanssonia centrifuga TaxID=98765 RepID=A0A2R6NPF1_9APHY|nr:hypothetical protein PHLCEN_2v9866 [Hermanssonia centrifuga]
MDHVDAKDCYYVFTYVLRKLCYSESRELQPLSKLEGQLQSNTYKKLDNGQHFDMGRTQLQKIYNNMIDSQSPLHWEHRSSGVHTMMLELLCSVSKVHMTEGTRLISADGPWVFGWHIDNKIRLAVEMFDQNTGYLDSYARHQFVMMADLVMRSLDDCYYVLDNDLMGTLKVLLSIGTFV